MLKVRSVLQGDRACRHNKLCRRSFRSSAFASSLTGRLRRCSSTSRVLFLLLFLFIVCPLSAHCSSKDLVQYVRYDFAKNFDYGPEANLAVPGIGYGLNYKNQLLAEALYSSSWVTNDFLITVTFWPQELQVNRYTAFGLKTTLHFLDFDRFSTEQDYLAEPILKLGTDSFYIQGGMFLGIKRTAIKVLDESFYDFYPCYCVQAAGKINSIYELYGSFSTHDNRRYYLFSSPLYTLGASVNLENRAVFSLEAEAHCADMFTAKFYLNGFSLGTSLKVML